MRSSVASFGKMVNCVRGVLPGVLFVAVGESEEADGGGAGEEAEEEVLSKQE